MEENKDGSFLHAPVNLAATNAIGIDRRKGNMEENKHIGSSFESWKKEDDALSVNALGIDRRKLRLSTGRPKGARNLNAKHPSSIARAFKKAGLNWQEAFALAIKAANNYGLPLAARRQAREDIKMWLRLLPYLVTTTNRMKVKRWKGKASKAALVALNALEGK